jgi:anti-sigma regulatory factor (Ser/Thr protein kinase)
LPGPVRELRVAWVVVRCSSIYEGAMSELLAISEFPPTMDAPRRARRLVTRALEGLDPAAIDVAVLATSELATNAVAHAPGPFVVRVSRDGTMDGTLIRIEVCDRSDAIPLVQSVSRLRGGGRGLSIVSQIARSWGVEPEPGGGKTVWCEILASS